MPTIQEITAALQNLRTEELLRIEQVIHNLYRTRDVHIIYDDDYGIWTEKDQNFAAAFSFKQLDEKEVHYAKDRLTKTGDYVNRTTLY